MTIVLTVKDNRKHLVCKSEIQQLEIYYYEENQSVYSLHVIQQGKSVKYGVFRLKSMAKQMGYWLSSQYMQNNAITKEAFINASLENGTYKWLVE